MGRLFKIAQFWKISGPGLHNSWLDLRLVGNLGVEVESLRR
jgi:hypothetical protein